MTKLEVHIIINNIYRKGWEEEEYILNPVREEPLNG